MTRQTLVLLLTGPLQSWGERSSFNYRDTQAHPTLSGVLGLLASASGITRDEPLPEAWSALRMLTRVDRPGTLLTDYHTIGGGYPPAERMITADKGRRSHAVITERAYLSDAAFTVYLQGPATVTDALARALKAPYWPPYLGRRGCPPSLPVFLGTATEDKEEIAARLPLYRASTKTSVRAEETLFQVAAYLGTEPSGQGKNNTKADHRPRDVPRFNDSYGRSFTTRLVSELSFDFTNKKCAGIGISAYKKIVQALKESA